MTIIENSEEKHPVVRLHRTRFNTYHAPHDLGPDEEVFTVLQAIHHSDNGPWCDDCGACDCRKTGQDCMRQYMGLQETNGCIGLQFAYADVIGGDVLCPSCMMKNYNLQIIPCPNETSPAAIDLLKLHKRI